jgi:hypothetical protein
MRHLKAIKVCQDPTTLRKQPLISCKSTHRNRLGGSGGATHGSSGSCAIVDLSESATLSVHHRGRYGRSRRLGNKLGVLAVVDGG